jgi:hypothetical protein
MHGVSRDAESLMTGEEKASRAKKTTQYIKLKDEALAMVYHNIVDKHCITCRKKCLLMMSWLGVGCGLIA